MSRALDERLASLSGWHKDEIASLRSVLAPTSAPQGTAILASERYAALGRLLKQLSSHRPVVVVLDDVHWGRDALAFLHFILSRVADFAGRLLFVATAREEALWERPMERDALQELGKLGLVRILDLEPLDEETHRNLVSELAPLDPALARQVAVRTCGNPLFAIQLLGDWVERSLLSLDGEYARLSEGVNTPIPSSMASFWEERVDRVLQNRPAQDRQALEMASLAGYEVDLSLWEKACRRGGLEPCYGLLESLFDRRLALASRDGSRWSFVHGMLRETIANRAYKEGRAERQHRAWAQALGEVEASSEILAPHLLAAGVVEEAIPLFRGAVDGRLKEGDFCRAESLLAQWERAFATSEDRHPEWTIRKARCDCGLGRYDAAKVGAQRVRVDGEGQLRAEAILVLAQVERFQGRPDAALALLAEVESLLSDGQADSLLWECKLDSARILLNQPGGLAQAVAHAESALALAPGPEERARSILYRGEVDRQAGDFPSAKGRFLQALEGFESCGARLGVALCHNVLGEIARYEQRLQEAEEHYVQARRMLVMLGSDHRLQPEVNLGLVLLEQHRFREARPLLRSALGSFELRKILPMEAAMHICLLPCAADAGDWEAWDHHAQRAGDLLERTGVVDIDNARNAQLGGEVALAKGCRDAAMVAFELALQQWRALGKAEEVAALEKTLASVPAVIAS